jgi:hypothetical protein
MRELPRVLCPEGNAGRYTNFPGTGLTSQLYILHGLLLCQEWARDSTGSRPYFDSAAFLQAKKAGHDQ